MWEGGVVTTDPPDGSLQVEEALLLQQRAESHLLPVLPWVFDLLTLWTGFDSSPRLGVRRATSYTLSSRYVPRFWHDQDEKQSWLEVILSVCCTHTTWLHLPFCITNSQSDQNLSGICVQNIWACDSVYFSLRSSPGRKASGGWSKHSKWVNPPPVVLSNNPWKCANGPKVPSFRSPDVKNTFITQN